ncbi:MAG TPA: SCO1664 family protein [Candidatus Limnocylindrales bacterium]|nr:SCO1664 family protein [Candidatus Limnocylindrales bacterium]
MDERPDDDLPASRWEDEPPDDGEGLDDGEDESDDDGETESIERLGLPMPVLASSDALDLLHHGELRVVGRLWASSNNALLCLVTRPCPDPEPDLVAACIYKPVMGERPLDDFPDGTLARREAAAYAASEASGWGIVPPTVLREGPFGEGMVQLWIRTDDAVDPVELVVNNDERLRRVAVFDAAVNNTDRKAGHLLPVHGGHVYGVDHGVTFSPVPKLRTVLWGWRGEPLADGELDVLRRLRAAIDGSLGTTLHELLDPIEVRATARRIDRLLEAGTFPQPDPRRPALPWPPV